MNNNFNKHDLFYMDRAIRLARLAEGHTAPNPPVGAVVVKDGRIIGEGYHKKAGTPHAEINALSQAGDASKGATLYVTLEPCNHYGKTPPCSKAVLAAGISRVVIGFRDPNPKAQGGADFLTENGVTVQTGCRQEECRLLVMPFVKHVLTQMPWVRCKVAMSLDGKIATKTGNSKWITNSQARSFGHKLRARSQAILVGIGTAQADNPELTCRVKTVWARNPVRVVLDSKLEIAPDCKLCQPSPQGKNTAKTIVIASDLHRNAELVQKKAEMLQARGVDVWFATSDSYGRPDLQHVLAMLGGAGIQSVLVEGGARIHGAFWDAGLVDEAFFFYAPIVLGSSHARSGIEGTGVELVSQAMRLKDIKIRHFDDNWMVSGELN